MKQRVVALLVAASLLALVSSAKDCSLGGLAGESMFWSRLGFSPDPCRRGEGGKPVVDATLTPEMAARHRMMQDAGVRVHTSVLFSGWVGPDAYDYSYTDATLRHLFTAVPEAKYLPRVKLNPPMDWIKAHPEEVFVYPDGPTDPEAVRALVGSPDQARDGGGYVVDRSAPGGASVRRPAKIGLQSFASERWLGDADEALRRLIAHLRASPYADRIVGLHVAWGACGETCMWGRDERRYGDKSRVFARAFRAWGGTGPVDAENEAFKRFVDHLNVSIANRLGGTVKALMGRDFPVGIFYGYMLECHNAAYTGWLGYEDLLKSPNVDFWAGPISYFDRGAGRPGGWLAPAASVNRHKQWVDEIDVRTFRSDPKSGFGRCATAAATKAVLAREMCKSLSTDSLYWWMDLGYGWYDGPEMAAIVRELEAVARSVRARRHASRADVLYVVDEDAMRRAPMDGARFNRRRVSLRAMFHSGMLIDIYRAADLADLPLDRYKAIVSFDAADARFPARTYVPDEARPLPDVAAWRRLFDAAGCRAYAAAPAAVYGDNRFYAVFPADNPEKFSIFVHAEGEDGTSAAPAARIP